MSNTAKRLPSTAWKPGQSGNPRGRPRTGYALAEKIREIVDPEEMVRAVLNIALGKAKGVIGEDGHGGWAPVVDAKTQLAAWTFLADRGFLKPPSQSQIETTVTHNEPRRLVDFSRLSQQDRDAFEQLMLKATSEGADDE